MKRTFLAILFSILVTFAVKAQETKLPVKIWPSVSNNIAILFISGDGGMGGFSNSFCQAINQKGNKITALDAKKYFWEKKTPGQASKDMISLLTENGYINKVQQLVLIGYSFGADVAPFIANAMPDFIKSKMKTVVLLSPSTTTDFEIHVTDLLGVKQKRSMDVIAEINKMTVQKVVTLFGKEEKGFPLQEIHLKSLSNEVLPGGHHFDGNATEVAKVVSKYF